MPYLIAQGPQPHHRWRRLLPENTAVQLGRNVPRWQVDWDPLISGQHIEMKVVGDKLVVKQLSSASNPVYVEGAPSQQFERQWGEHFVIGETTFTLLKSEILATLDHSTPVMEKTFLPSDLQMMQFDVESNRIDLLGQLPNLISNAVADQDLFSHLVTWLFKGIPRAAGIAFVSWQQERDSHEPVQVLYWDYRGPVTTTFAPSQHLIHRAIESDVSTLHFWNPDSESEYTEFHGIDWAFCIPLSGASCQGWGLYIAGRGEADLPIPDDSMKQLQIKLDMKYAQLAASTLSNLRSLKFLERTTTHFRQFFPDVVVDALQSSTPDELLSPRESDVSVLFCDLRGFTRTSELSSNDLMELLKTTSQSLSVMTKQVLYHQGVIGDFHGDTVMGFWGWPVSQDIQISALQACQTALEITRIFQQHSPVQQATLGIASGLAVAGKIGSDDQVKVSVLGPVVNLAARLESMNRQFGTTILIDQATAQLIESSELELNTVKLATVQPYGMNSHADVFLLLHRESYLERLPFFQRYSFALEKLKQGDLASVQRELASLVTEEPTETGFVNLLLNHVQLQCVLAQQPNHDPSISPPHIIQLLNK